MCIHIYTYIYIYNRSLCSIIAAAVSFVGYSIVDWKADQTSRRGAKSIFQRFNYVYMYSCMYVCMYACMHVCMYVCNTLFYVNIRCYFNMFLTQRTNT